MSQVFDFLQKCGTFFVLTINKNFPAGRPFGAVMEIDNDLYISTSDTKAVYKQLKQNGNIQLVALKDGSREWVRITGHATECNSLEIKIQMLEKCPILKKHFPTLDRLAIFQVKISEAILCSDNGTTPIC